MPEDVRKLQPAIQTIMRGKMEVAQKAQAKVKVRLQPLTRLRQLVFFEHRKQEGIQKDPSGFYYEILKEGNGGYAGDE